MRLNHAVAISAAAMLAACAINPVTGERQLSLVSEAQEVEMGRAAADDVRRTIGLVDDARLQRYMRDVGLALARDSERPTLPWSFAVVDDPTPNAFALPGGFIFVTRGMVNLMESEAELASVLGHEVGHVTARHSVSQISQQQLAQVGLGLGGALFPQIQPFGQAIGAGLQLLFLRHSRDDERQADELGFGYALRHDYDVGEMADVFESLQRLGDQGGSLPGWLTTHPSEAERIETIQARAAKLPPGARGTVVRRAEYLTRIDGLVYGENPRQGFFKDGVFYHPDLRFRLPLPAEWQGRNLPGAVVAVSPRQDAAMELTLAASTDAGTAQRQFLAQPGITPLRTATESIHGLQARVSVFEARTDQGVLRGLSAHIPYGDRTYQIVTYAPAASFQAYSGAFEGIVRGFGPLTDAAMLAVAPKRMDIVRIGRAMTLDEVSRQYPSAVPTRVLAVLNQLDDAGERLSAGSLVKRVVEG
ncbi:MAG: M48 family metalloprotease [Vicinamibacterales bacterium]